MTSRGRTNAITFARQAVSTSGGPGRWLTPVAVTIIVLSTALRAWAVYRGGFYGDDFVFLADVARGRVDAGWFLQRYNVQFLPLGLALVVPVAAVGTFVWAAAATELVLFHLMCLLACWLMLRTLFGRTPRILVPLAFYAFSAISMPAIMWWSGGISLVTVQLPTFLGIAAHVAYLRTSRKRFAVAAAACLVVALGFYVKAMFFPVAMGIVTLVYFVGGRPDRRLLEALRRWWLVWALYAAIGSAYLVGYLRVDGSPTQTDGGFDVGDAVQGQLLGALGPGLLGGPWSWAPLDDLQTSPRQLADAPQLVQIVAALTIVLLLLYFAGRYRGAMRPLWFLLPCIGLAVGAVLVSRVATYGAASTQELRYWSDTLPYFTLAVGLMCTKLPGTPDPLSLRDDPIIARSMSRTVVAVLAAAYVVGGVLSSISYANPWHDKNPATSFVEVATSQLEAQPAPIALADEQVPEGALASLFYPYTLVSEYLAPLDRHFTTPDVANDIHVLDGFGLIVPGAATPDVDVPAANLTQCLGGTQVGQVETVQLGSSTYDYPFWASVTYRASATTPVRVVAGGEHYDTTFLSGRHVLTFRTTGSFDAMLFALGDDARVCIDSIRIGQHVVAR
jgi:hypothetical protein